MVELYSSQRRVVGITVADLGNEKGGIWTVVCEVRRKIWGATPTSGHVLAIFQ